MKFLKFIIGLSIASVSLDVAALDVRRAWDADAMIASAGLSQRELKNARNDMIAEAERLINLSYDVELDHDDLAVILNFGTDELFMPNEDVFRTDASERLKSFANAVDDHEAYRIVIVIHTDNTGNAEYQYSLGKRRLTVIDSYLERHGVRTDDITFVSRGNNDPIVNDDSMAHRRTNRRIEVIFLPGLKQR